MEKITKAMKYQMIEDILGNIEGDDIDMLIEFVKGEQAALGRKAAKAKEKAAEKKTEIDPLGNAVLNALTHDPMGREEIFALVENFSDDVTVAKVGARLTKLVAANLVIKSEVKATSASGKKTTRMVYAVPTLTATEIDE